jgi:hypothetical protein
MTLAKHVAISGRDRQRSRRHLADPQVGRQYGARVRNVSPRSKGGSSSSIQDDQSASCHRHHQSSAGQYSAPGLSQETRSNDQNQQDDQAR